MTPISPWGLLPVCDIVYMPCVPKIEFRPKHTGVVMCHSLYSVHVTHVLEQLDRDGSFIFICREADDPLELDFVEKYPQVKYWFTTNCAIRHEKVEAIPSGLSFGSLERTHGGWQSIKSILATERTTINSVFGCFSMNSRERSKAKETLSNRPYVTWMERLGSIKYWDTIYRHEFNLSPEGQGKDCVRTWETLYLGRFPIVKRCQTYEHFDDMPIAMVDDWSEVNETWLAKTRIEMETRSTTRLYLEYWLNRIAVTRDRYL